MKFQTLHPDPSKQGTNIDKSKYDQVKSALLQVLGDGKKLSFNELLTETKNALIAFDGSRGWYITTVKLDLEARGEIVVDRSKSPQLIYLP